MDKGFFDSIVNGLIKFIGAFKKHGVAVCTYILLLFIIFYMMIINPINVNSIVERLLEKERENTLVINDNSMKQRLKAEEILMPVLTELVDEDDDINRSMVLELHNSVLNVSHIDILYLSSTFETISRERTDLDIVSDSFQRVPTTVILGLNGLNNLRYKKYIYYADALNGKNSNSRMYNKLHKLGSNAVGIIPITNHDGVPILLLILTSDKDFNMAEKYEKISPIIKQIKTLLHEEGVNR